MDSTFELTKLELQEIGRTLALHGNRKLLYAIRLLCVVWTFLVLSLFLSSRGQLRYLIIWAAALALSEMGFCRILYEGIV